MPLCQYMYIRLYCVYHGSIHAPILPQMLLHPNTELFPIWYNAQCTPTDWQSAVGAIANCRLRIGVSR